MISVLDEAVQRIHHEIEQNGFLVVDKQVRRRNLLGGCSLYAGLCHAAVERMGELLQGYAKVTAVSFHLEGEGVHCIAKVVSPEGTWHVDPTIEQYIPGANAVYSEQDTYPLRTIQGTMHETQIS